MNIGHSFLALLLASLFCFAASPTTAGVMKIELPAETASFKTAPGSDLANGQCLTCHSVDYVTMQPPFPHAFWLNEVKKMRDKYGAAIAEDLTEPLANYLTRNYGVETNATSVASNNFQLSTFNLQPGLAPPRPLTPEGTAALYGCLTCHSVDHKIVGPAYKDVAAKYRNDPQAFAKIAEQIHKGGSGKWGPVIMPPFSFVPERETELLADWILGQK